MAKPTWNGFMGSGYYNASGVAALQAQLANYSTDKNVLAQQATAQYQPTYDSSVLAAKQEIESILGGYGNQLSGLGQTYDLQRRTANSQYDQSGNDAMSQLGKRGLGRSSVVGTTLGTIEAARGQALSDIGTKESDAYGDIYNNMSLAQKQGAEKLTGLQNSYAQQIEARVNELYNTNAAAAASLQAQIAQLQQAAYQQYVAQWNKTHKKSSSSGKSSGSSSSASAAPVNSAIAGALAGAGGTNNGNWFATGYR